MPETSPIDVFCDTCGHAFRVRPKAAGRRVGCPSCKQPTMVPKPPESADPEPDFPNLDDSPAAFPGLDNSPPSMSYRHVGSGPVATAAAPSIAPSRPKPNGGRSHESVDRGFRWIRGLVLALRVLAVLILVPWALGTLVYFFSFYAATSAKAPDLPDLPAGITVEDDPFDTDLDLTEEQRDAIIAYQIAKAGRGAGGAVMFLGFFPWVASTIASFLGALVALAFAEILLLAIQVERNTYAAAHG